MNRTSTHPRTATDHHLKLVQQFPLRPIRNKTEYRQAQKIMERLAVRNEGTLERGEQDYLDMLSLAIEEYDREHRPAQKQMDPIKLLKFLMRENKMNVTALGELVGSKSLASLILSGKRGLSKSVIAKLADRFKVEASAFLPTA